MFDSNFLFIHQLIYIHLDSQVAFLQVADKFQLYRRFPPITTILHTAVGLRKTSLLHKQIKNRATLAYKNSVRKCYQGSFFIANMQFNNPTSMPQT